MMPDNDSHRRQVFRSIAAAYANAATYCDRYAKTCERLVARFNDARIAVAYETVDLSKPLTRSTLQQPSKEERLLRDPYRP